MKLKKYGKGGANGKPKKPNLKKTETFLDYKTAASQFSDYNPGSDTVFVGTSLDPGGAERQTQNSANVSSAKGASDSNYNDIPKMYKTKNEKGQTVYVSLSKHDKYSEGGTMKLKKYGKGGKYEMYNKGGVSPKKSYSKGGDVDPPQKKPVYGPPKPPGYKEPTEKEREESRGEAAYLKRRKEADRAYRQAIKEGATEAQAVKIAEKYLSQGGKMYLTGGQVKLKKK